MMSNQSGSASIGELCSSNDQCSIFSKTSVSVSDYQYFSTWIIDDVGKSIIIIPVQYELLQPHYIIHVIWFHFCFWTDWSREDLSLVCVGVFLVASYTQRLSEHLFSFSCLLVVGWQNHAVMWVILQRPKEQERRVNLGDRYDVLSMSGSERIKSDVCVNICCQGAERMSKPVLIHCGMYFGLQYI